MRALAAGTRGSLALVVVLAAIAAGVGWLYAMRDVGWLAAGPRLPDALPLLQLAGTDGQPLSRVALAWLPAGIAAGLALSRLPRPWRAALAGALGLGLLLLASQSSYALARNVRLSDVLWTRDPGSGAWVEALLFAIGCALPPTRGSRRTARAFAALRPRAGDAATAARVTAPR
jgi:hypothetical protein